MSTCGLSRWVPPGFWWFPASEESDCLSWSCSDLRARGDFAFHSNMGFPSYMAHFFKHSPWEFILAFLFRQLLTGFYFPIKPDLNSSAWFSGLYYLTLPSVFRCTCDLLFLPGCLLSPLPNTVLTSWPSRGLAILLQPSTPSHPLELLPDPVFSAEWSLTTPGCVDIISLLPTVVTVELTNEWPPSHIQPIDILCVQPYLTWWLSCMCQETSQR